MKVLLRFLVFITVTVLLIVFLQLRAHVPQSSALPQATLGESYPSMGDAGSYAENEGISVDGTLQRRRISDIAGRLDADLTVNETETFAGLWIEHSPEFKIVVLFTENPQQTLQPYLSKDD